MAVCLADRAADQVLYALATAAITHSVQTKKRKAVHIQAPQKFNFAQSRTSGRSCKAYPTPRKPAPRRASADAAATVDALAAAAITHCTLTYKSRTFPETISGTKRGPKRQGQLQ